MLKYIDVHTHLCDPIIKNRFSEVRSAYLDAGIIYVVDSGCCKNTSYECSENANNFKEVYFTAGIHPEYAGQTPIGEESFLSELGKHSKCIAIGEIGLDYHYGKEHKDRQIELFKSQLKIANELSLPVVIHSRDACKDTFDIIKENISILKNGFLMHCYSESKEIAKELVKLGAYFSFGGSSTFKNSKKAEVIKEIPLDRLLIETDAPFLTPEPLRGRPNESKNVVHTYSFIAKTLNLTECELTEICFNNFKKLFKKIK